MLTASQKNRLERLIDEAWENGCANAPELRLQTPQVVADDMLMCDADIEYFAISNGLYDTQRTIIDRVAYLQQKDQQDEQRTQL